ncbi:phosphocholine cytidylyltransferase family protein [bacterium]|nr:phosphocholine cytidylyltransferase family protein [bacterium]
MKAIILAAGQGKRLLPLTQDTPKTLLNISGTTILEYQLVTLASCNVKEVVLVGGFRVDKLKDYADRYIALHGLDLKLKVINNKDYAITNNLYSLWLAKDEMTSDFLVINGDNVFDRRAIVKMIQQKDITAAVAIHKNPGYDDEDMKVRIAGSNVVEISKGIDNLAANGESIGLRLFRGKGVAAFKYAMDIAMIEDVKRNAYFVRAIQHMIDMGHNVGFTDVTEFKYGELDFFEDLKNLEIEMSGMMKQSIMMHTNPASLYAVSLQPYRAAGMKKAS